MTMIYPEYPKLKKRPRTLLPEHLRAPVKWLRQFISNIDWGIAPPDKLQFTRTNNRRVLDALNQGRRAPPKTEDWKAHFARHVNLYFTADYLKSSILVMGDIDVKKGIGTPEGGLQALKLVRDKLFPNVYWERSSGGQGINFWFLVDTEGLKPSQLKHLLKLLESRLIEECKHCDIKQIEICGTGMVVDKWNDQGRAVKVTQGQPARLPQDSSRFDAWKATTRFSGIDLYGSLQNWFNNKTTVEKGALRKTHGSVMTFDRIDPKFRRIAANKLWPWRRMLEKVDGMQITQEDCAVFLAVQDFCKRHPNPDQSNPKKRAEALWKAMYHGGATARAWNCRRYARIRDFLTVMGYIVWMDNTYRWGYTVATDMGDETVVPGVACKWNVSDALLPIGDTTNNNTTTHTVFGEGHVLEGPGLALVKPLAAPLYVLKSAEAEWFTLLDDYFTAV